MAATDLTGQVFGRLTVVGPGPKGGARGARWECSCECGNSTTATTWELTSGRKRSCGCLRADTSKLDITGARFGELVAVEATDKRKYRTVVWKCACDCGAECEVPLRDLRSGRTKNCGGPAHRKAAKPASKAANAKIDGPRPGQRFGKLIAVNALDVDINRGTTWRCVCDCDRAVYARASDLLSGEVVSCGECE